VFLWRKEEKAVKKWILTSFSEKNSVINGKKWHPNNQKNLTSSAGSAALPVISLRSMWGRKCTKTDAAGCDGERYFYLRIE